MHIVALRFPLPGVPVFVVSDASQTNAGGYGYQIVDGETRLLGFTLKAFNKHQLAWPIATKELYALCYMLGKLSHCVSL